MSRLVMFEHNPRWETMFASEKEQLSSIWNGQAISISHIGSTSVPGLKAKPIIDIMIVIKDDSIIPQYDEAMTSLGYRCRGECLDQGGTPGRFYYSKDVDGLRAYQVHVLKDGHFDIKCKLDFRDYLRAHPKVAEEYGKLKTKLIEENTQGIFEYMAGKDQFVKECIADATRWRSTEQCHATDA